MAEVAGRRRIRARAEATSRDPRDFNGAETARHASQEVAAGLVMNFSAEA